MPTTAHTVTILQAFQSTGTGLLVLDTPANIAAALPNPALVARVASFTVTSTSAAPAILAATQLLTLASLGSILHAPPGALELNTAATLTVAQLNALETLPGFILGSAARITLSDTLAHISGLLTTHPAYFAQVASIAVSLDVTSIGAYQAIQLNGLATHGKALSFIPSAGHTTLNIAATAHDLGADYAGLNALGQHQALAITLTNDGTSMGATDAAGLVALNGFSITAHTLSVSDTAAAIQAHTAQVFGQGFTQIQVTSGSLSGVAAQLLDPTLHFAAGATATLAASTTQTAAGASALATLPGFHLAGGITLAVADTAANLAATSAAWVHLASSATLTADATVSAANCATLAQIAGTLGTGFSLGGHALIVSDTVATLIALPQAVTSLATALSLSADATVTATQLAAFAALPHATLAGHTLSVADSAANLLSLSSASLADAASATLTADATLSVTAFTALRALPHVSLGGHLLTVADSPANLAGLNGSLALASGTTLTASAVVSATQITALAALPNLSLAGNVLNVSDSAANLLALSPSALAIAGSVTLYADATVSAAQAAILFAEPGFSSGTHHLTIADTAASLASLPSNQVQAAYALALSGDQTVSASLLTHLATLGSSFGLAGHVLTCADTAANLSLLSPAAAALASAEIVTAPATVSAATAQLLATMTHLSLGAGASLTVQDTVINLVALGHGVPSITAAVQLALGSTVTITAALGHALSSIPHFTNAGASITVTDSIANLNASPNTGWQSVETATQITDTAANLAAASSTSLVQSASQVSLSANAQIGAAAAAQIAVIPHFTPGIFQLTVVDTAANVATYEASVITVASSAIVTDSGPISAAVATQLAAVSQAGKLTFQGGDQLIVQDNLAALTSPINAAGLALASRISVVDTAANLATATSNNWGGVSPTYALSQGGVITAAQATILAGLGSHFSAGTYTISVADTAVAVVNAAAALTSLNITASVSDTSAHLRAQEVALQGLNALTSVHVTDTAAVNAATAAAISGLASKISGPAFHVADTANNVDASLSNLAALGTHVAITLTDTAANVAPLALDLATLGSAIAITLTDSTPVTAVVAAGLAPVAADIAANTRLSVSDTASAIVSNATGLAALGNDLGTLTITDGTSVSVTTAAALAPLANHLAAGVQLTAAGITAAAVTTNLAALETLQTEGRLASVQVSATTVADATANATALNALPAHLTILDTPNNVQSGLDALSGITGLQSITLQTGSIATFTVSLSAFSHDASVFAAIASPYTIAITDTAANIEHDLTLGNSSVILANHAHIGAITTAGAQPLVLTQAQILALGVDDGPSSAMFAFSGPVSVTGVDVAHVQQIATLSHAPVSMSVIDTSATISNDFALGNGSALLANRGLLASITSSDAAPVTLTAQQALSANVDDGIHSGIALLHGASLSVTGATVAQLSALGAMQVPASTISVSDTAANLSADLAAGNSQLVSGLPAINAVTVSDGGTIVLTETQLLALHVDDGAGSILSETTGGHLAVTQAAAGDLGILLALGVPPTSISITDTAAHIVSQLSTLETDIGHIAAITITGTPLVLTAGEALASAVDDGPGSILDRVSTHAFNVSGATVAQLPSLLALPDRPGSIAVNDSAANIAADLASGNSALAADLAYIGSVTTTHGTLSLTDAQANAILTTPALDNVMLKLAPSTIVSISGTPIADLSGFAGSGWPHVSVAITDSAANIAADLGSSTSSLNSNAADVASVAVNADATINAGTATEFAALAHFSTGGHTLTVQDNGSNIAALGTPAQSIAGHIVVVDGAQNIASLVDTLQANYHGNLVIDNVDNGYVYVSAAQYVTDKPTLDAISGSVNVFVFDNAASVAALVPQLLADPEIVHVGVEDNAANTIAALTNLIPLSNVMRVYLSDTTISAAQIAQLYALGNVNILIGPNIADTASQIAALAEVGNPGVLAYIANNGAIIQGDNTVTSLDATALGSLSGFHAANGSLVVWDTAAHLVAPAYASALSNANIASIHLKAPGDTVTVTTAALATLFSLPHFSSANPDGSANALFVSDTAAHIEANIAALRADAPGNVSSLTVNASAVVTASTLTDLQSLGAVAGNSVHLTVLDTAVAIVTGSAASSPSIRPTAWLLSGNGTVTEGQAVTLANLVGFSANGHSLTLSINADTQIALSDIQALASIAGALDLNGHHLIVSDTVAHLISLSPAALALATPAITDSLANVAALPSDSSLLHGTIEITDAAAITAAQAYAVTTLASTLAPGAVTIDHMHAIADTIGNLRSLLINPTWTANSALRSSFTLAAQDSVSNLVNPSNTAFLHGLAASSLPGNVTTTAASAAALASLAPTIHFSQGANHVTVSDTAAHLLSANNAAGLALASTVTLAGPEQLDAADAEQLLQIGNLSIATPITIADNSTNLLDGVLGGLIANSGFAAYITVQLAGPEILDADAAESLVNLPGFSDTHNLSIADSSSYLLNGNNLSAEQMASSVTLAGDETVSAHTIQRLSQVPHFSPGLSHLVLAGNDYADAATLKAVADESAAVQVGNHTITMAQDVLDLSPAEYAALQADHVVAAGHALGVSPGIVSVTDINGSLSVSGLGIAGGTVHVYTDAGELITSNVSPTAGFTIHAADVGRNFAITETVGGVEGAPLVVLDAGAVEAAVAAAHGSLNASPGGIQVDSGKYITLYQAGSIPQGLQTAALVYDPVAHTIALDVAGNMTTLITLGGTAHPSNLSASDILFKQHG